MTPCGNIAVLLLLTACGSAAAAQVTTQHVPGANGSVEVEAAAEVPAKTYNAGMAAKAGEYCAPGGCESAPTLLSARAPVYPAQFLRAGIEGEASVMFDIDTQGLPQNVTVHSATEELFGVAAAEAVRNWRFQPARLGGKPVVFKHALQTFPFELRD